jgi:hypothetical protein
MGTAPRRAVLDCQVTAGNVKHSIGVEITVRVPEGPERNSLGVSQQPGGLVIEGGGTVVDATDSEEDT